MTVEELKASIEIANQEFEEAATRLEGRANNSRTAAESARQLAELKEEFYLRIARLSAAFVLDGYPDEPPPG